MNVAEAVGQTLAGLGVNHVFGVVGSGNFHVTNALVAGGASFVAARHEGGAATMADAYSRVSGTVAVVTVHQGCGLTNALTGITEAAKSRTPLVVLAAETTAPRSNFYVDQAALATAVGAVAHRVTSPESAVAECAAAFFLARDQRRTVILNLPLELQEQDVPEQALTVPPAPELSGTAADPSLIEQLVAAIKGARRPVFIAGRGARSHAARDAIAELAQQSGALLATSAVARGLFHGQPFALDVSGGFASPLAAELITDADLIVGWGCSMNMWTMRHGRLIGPEATVAQIDIESGQLGANRPIDIGITGGAAEVASQVVEELRKQDHHRSGYRSEDLADRLASELRWRDVPYDDDSTEDLIDPRTFSIGLDDILPAERILAIDSGNFMGYPSMFLSVPDENGMCFTQAYQSIGLGLATAIGAALARPDRLPVAALGDGGALMGIAELDTVVRLGIGMLILVYNDDGYGAEVHHFTDGGYPMGTVTFPDTDIASIGAGFGCESVTVRRPSDLEAVQKWVQGPRNRPLLVDAKVTREQPSWWLEEAFRGH